MTKEELAIPLPTRPGTMWLATPRKPFGLACGHCGQGYSRHGAPEDIADAFGVPYEKRHLICPASNEAWEEYNYQRRIATYEGARREVIRALEALRGHDAAVPLDQIAALLPERPTWIKLRAEQI